MALILQAFFVKRTTAADSGFLAGMVAGKGISYVAEKAADGTIKRGIEADFIRTRISAASIELLPGVQGIGGLFFCNPSGQIKKIESNN